MQTIRPDVADEYIGEPQRLGEYEGFEVYAMPAFVTFPASDPAELARWYVDALGFGVMYVAPEVGGVTSMVHLRRRMYQDILLVAAAIPPAAVHLDATGELDELARRSASFATHDGPQPTPYGPMELHLVDPAGNRLVLFAAPERPAASIEEAMKSAAARMEAGRSDGMESPAVVRSP